MILTRSRGRPRHRAAPPAGGRLIRSTGVAAWAVSASPVQLLRAASLAPDPWQVDVLGARGGRVIVVAGRQSGKGLTCATKATHHAAFIPDQLVLIVATGERQAKNTLAKVRGLLPSLGAAAVGVIDTAEEIRFANGSKIVTLPASSATIRGWTANLLIIDEGAFVPRSTWEAVVPTIASTEGDIWVVSSASGPAGWMYELWSDEITFPEWARFEVPATIIPRISPKFLEGERRRLSRAAFGREYMCQWVGAEGAVFDADDIAAALAAEATPGWQLDIAQYLDEEDDDQ